MLEKYRELEEKYPEVIMWTKTAGIVVFLCGAMYAGASSFGLLPDMGSSRGSIYAGGTSEDWTQQTGAQREGGRAKSGRQDGGQVRQTGIPVGVGRADSLQRDPEYAAMQEHLENLRLSGAGMAPEGKEVMKAIEGKSGAEQRAAFEEAVYGDYDRALQQMDGMMRQEQGRISGGAAPQAQGQPQGRVQPRPAP